MSVIDPVELSDEDLTSSVVRLAGHERAATAALVAHLAEFDARRLFEGAGYSSLFEYCVSVLHLSKDAAYNRIEAARAVRRFPAIIEMLERGALTLTTARMLARQLTAENQHELLAAAAGRDKEGIEELLAHWFPQPDVEARIRKLPVAGPFAKGDASGVASAGSQGPNAPSVDVVAEPPPTCALEPRPKPGVVRPLAPARYEIRFTAREETREKLRRAQDLLSHAVPSGDIAEVVDRALTLLVADLERKKFAATPRPRRQGPRPVADDTVPAAVRRVVSARDQGRCAFVSASGHRCGAMRFLEFHHLLPRACGGLATVENIGLRCRAHNGYEVDRFFGPGVRRLRDRVRGTVMVGWARTEPRGRSGTT